jgi:hypothetical protein
MLTDEMIKQLEILDEKERLLSEIVVWLKAKGLWEQCCKDIPRLNHLLPESVNQKLVLSDEDAKEFKEEKVQDQTVVT